MMMTLRSRFSSSVRKRLPNNKNEKRNLAPNEEVIFVEGEILSGIYPVQLSLKSGLRKFNAVYYNEHSKRAKQIVESTEVKAKCGKIVSTTFEGISQLARQSEKGGKAVHQGICADVSRLIPVQWSPDEQDVDDDEVDKKLWLLLCSIRDPMNLGAILRSAYFLGVERVLITPECARLSPVVSKASAGVLEVFSPDVVIDPEFFLDTMSDRGWTVLGSSPSKDTATYASSKKSILIVGNEGVGVPQSLMSKCHSRINLKPGRKNIEPGIDSLNVSVATALLIQRIMR